MKKPVAPKDGKTFCADGRRFSSLTEVKIYAQMQEMYISHTATDGVFTYCDLALLNCEARDAYEMLYR